MGLRERCNPVKGLLDLLDTPQSRLQPEGALSLYWEYCKTRKAWCKYCPVAAAKDCLNLPASNFQT